MSVTATTAVLHKHQCTSTSAAHQCTCTTVSHSHTCTPACHSWLKKSGEEFGPNGYWKRWTLLSGASADGMLQWEEVWWEASDWSGLKELGAAKSGNSAEGGLLLPECAAECRLWAVHGSDSLPPHLCCPV